MSAGTFAAHITSAAWAGTPPPQQQCSRRATSADNTASHLEAHDEGLALDVGEGHVEVADVALRRVLRAVDDHHVQLVGDALL